MSDPRKKFLIGMNYNLKLRGAGKFIIEEMWGYDSNVKSDEYPFVWRLATSGPVGAHCRWIEAHHNR